MVIAGDVFVEGSVSCCCKCVCLHPCTVSFGMYVHLSFQHLITAQEENIIVSLFKLKMCRPTDEN